MLGSEVSLQMQPANCQLHTKEVLLHRSKLKRRSKTFFCMGAKKMYLVFCQNKEMILLCLYDIEQTQALKII